jgi:hypothetical protein
MKNEDFYLKVWRLHPNGVRIVPAEKTLNGTAHEAGVKFCGPFSTANKTGWWVFPAQDVDIMWKGGQDFEYKHHTNYSNVECELVRSLVKESDGVNPDDWCPFGVGRSKYSWGMVEEGVVQIWTGIILQTPPGWSIRVRSPVNFPKQPYYIMEGVLETDWMWYDLWTNVVFTEKNKWVNLRKDQWPPLAHLIPERREVNTENWEIKEEIVNRDTPEANDVFSYWAQYNHKKFSCGGKQYLSATDPSLRKNATTYYKERHKILDENKIPKDGAQQCPFHKKKKFRRKLL